ncbi:MAG TPA: hypothetical protein VM840_06060 [Actinomycetota bacterium]|nr:hypothetical protein [Actinomycetota bacterium]
MIAEGSRAPLFEAPSTQGTFVLRDQLDVGPVVLYFFPLADTPG